MEGKIVRVVTDSVGNLPVKLAGDLNILVVSQQVIIDGQAYRDGIDITAEEFYRRMERAKEITTSQASPGDFLKAYQEVARAGDCSAILVVTVSSKLSGTYQSAVTAAGLFSDLPVQVVDSRSASMGQGFVAIAAARAAAAGGGLPEVKAAAEATQATSRLYAALDTLKYLERGGRIGRAAAMAGTLLRVKPLISIDPVQGDVVPAGQARGTRQATEKVLDALRKDSAQFKDRRLHIAVVHAADPARAKELETSVAAEFKPVELHTVTITPAIGCHGGPGLIGLTYFFD